MKNATTICLVLLLFASCGSEPQNKYLTYQNIVILSDMSSRLDNRKPKDINEIQKIVQFFKTECVKPGEKIGDKSCISFSAFSEKTAATIDINKIKNLGEKQRFINSTAEYKNCGLTHQIANFDSIVKNVYANTRNSGLDLISLLIEKISNEHIVKEDTYLTDGVDTTYLAYNNHIHIFTDGYLEYLDKNKNSQFYFGNSEIEKVRKYCITNKVNISDALESDKTLCLPPSRHKLNKYIILHIHETHERDKNLVSQTYLHPRGQRDNEILEAVWKKWAKDSGFKDLTWDKY
ncbi:MAG: hypothetical protein EBU01_14635 [Crocinitomicaceae bacterium]|nr:hypothetical protein [Crocinitomicaceae bacterium]